MVSEPTGLIPTNKTCNLKPFPVRTRHLCDLLKLKSASRRTCSEFDVVDGRGFVPLRAQKA